MKTSGKQKLVALSDVMRHLRPNLSVVAVSPTAAAQRSYVATLVFGNNMSAQRRLYRQTRCGTHQIALPVVGRTFIRVSATVGSSGDDMLQHSLHVDIVVEDGGVEVCLVTLATLDLGDDLNRALQQRPGDVAVIVAHLEFALNGVLARSIEDAAIAERDIQRATMLGDRPVMTGTVRRDKQSSRASSASGNEELSWPIRNLVILALGGLLAYGVVTAVRAHARPVTPAQQAEATDPFASATKAIDPTSIGTQVRSELERIREGGGNPTSDINTGNVELEVMKKMGLQPGKASSGCLVSPANLGKQAR